MRWIALERALVNASMIGCVLIVLLAVYMACGGVLPWAT